MTIQTANRSMLEFVNSPVTCPRPAERLAVVDGRPVLGLTDGTLVFGDRVVAAHRSPLVTLTRFEGQLLTASKDGFAGLWDPSGRPLFVRRHPTGPLRSATLVDGTLILGDDNGYVFAWDLHTHATDFIGDLQAPVTAMCGEGSIVTMGTAEGQVVWDGQSEKRHQGAVRALYAVGGEEVLSIGEDGRVRFGSELLLRVPKGITGCSLYGARLLIAIDRELQEWDLRRLALRRRTTSTAGKIVDVALDDSGAWVLLEGERAPRHWT